MNTGVAEISHKCLLKYRMRLTAESAIKLEIKELKFTAELPS